MGHVFHTSGAGAELDSLKDSRGALFVWFTPSGKSKHTKEPAAKQGQMGDLGSQTKPTAYRSPPPGSLANFNLCRFQPNSLKPVGEAHVLLLGACFTQNPGREGTGQKGTSLGSWVSELDIVILFIKEAKTHNSWVPELLEDGTQRSEEPKLFLSSNHFVHRGFYSHCRRAKTSAVCLWNSSPDTLSPRHKLYYGAMPRFATCVTADGGGRQS